VSTGKKIKLAAVHLGFLVFYIAYCIFDIIQWRNISHSIDLISYLDVGDAYWRGDFRNAINHYWSPLYSWILGGVIAVFKPGIADEMLAVRCTNFALMMVLYGSFVYYAKVLWRGLNAKPLPAPVYGAVSEPLYWIYMYSILCFSALCYGGCDKDTPDVLVAAFVLLASTAFLKIRFGDRSFRNFLCMGIMLGLGYLAKAIMLPISLIYFACAFWEARKDKAVSKKLAIACGALAALAVPWIVLISTTFGYLTISDSSRTLALYSSGQNDQQVHFQFPELKHTTRKIFENPEVFEFASPISGTYPPWYNPAYWTEGAPNKEPIQRAAKYFVANVPFLLLEVFGFLIGGWLLASVLMRRSCFSLAGIAESFTVAAPALVAIAAYAITVNMNGHMMERYFIGWIVLLYSSILISLRFPSADVKPIERRFARGKRVLLGSIAAAMMTYTLAMLGMHNHMSSVMPVAYDTIVALKARELGLAPGDRIAQIGFRRYYWARLARLKIIADIFDIAEFWKMEPARREELIETLRAHRVKAIIQTWAVDVELPQPDPTWVKVPGTKALIYIIPTKDGASDEAVKNRSDSQ